MGSPGRGMQEDAEKGEQQVGKVRHQVRCGLKLDRKRQPTAPNCGQQFFAGMDGSLCPAMLLRLKSVHVHWQLSGSHDIGQKNKFPALELSAIAKIEIFTQSIMLPPSALFNTCAPPKTGGSVKVEKAATPAASG